MAQTFSGRTEDAEAPFLGASFWEVGKSVRGVISKIFDSRPQADKPAQRCYVLELSESVEIDGEEWDRVSVGNMAGFKMAMQGAKLDALRLKDVLTIECTGYKESKKKRKEVVDGVTVEVPFSPRVNFKIDIVRG